MAKIIIQMDLLSNQAISSRLKVVNVVGISGLNPGEEHFEALHNEEVILFSNQGCGLRLNYLRLGVNQCCNRERDDSWRDCEREWCKRRTSW